MKRSNKLPLVFAFIIFALSTSIVFANEPVIPTKANSASTYNDFTVFSEEEYDQIEANMLAGIKSGNAMIPLLKLVTNGKTEEARIIAALSLYKIESNIGMYRLKKLSETYEKSELVRKVFDRIYKVYISKNYSF